MNTESFLVLALTIVVPVCICIGVLLFYPSEEIPHRTLPTVAEARDMIAKKFPEHVDCFVLSQEGKDGLHGSWGFSLNSYGYYLVCRELGISIRVRIEK